MSIKRDVTKVVLSTPLFWMMSSCAGYQFAGEGVGQIDPRYRALAVVDLENRTTEPGLGAICARALEGAVLRSSRALVSRGEADLVIDGVVVEVIERVSAFGVGEGAGDAEIELNVNADLIVFEKQQELYRVRKTGRASYVTSGVGVQSDAMRSAALKRACGDAMRDGLATMERSLVKGVE